MTNNMSFADARKAIMAVDRLLDASSDPDLKPAVLKIESAIDRADDANRTPGQIAHEAYQESTPYASASWKSDLNDEDYWAAWESAAAAVIAHHEQQQTENAPTTAAPSWSPVVGGWAEHREWGRVLILRRDWAHGERVRLCARPVWTESKPATFWCPDADLSAPVPRVWSRAVDVPAHIVAVDSAGVEWAGADLIADDAMGIGHPLAPFTERLPVGGVW